MEKNISSVLKRKEKKEKEKKRVRKNKRNFSQYNSVPMQSEQKCNYVWQKNRRYDEGGKCDVKKTVAYILSSVDPVSDNFFLLDIHTKQYY